jgi:hypothetical protein
VNLLVGGGEPVSQKAGHVFSPAFADSFPLHITAKPIQPLRSNGGQFFSGELIDHRRITKPSSSGLHDSCHGRHLGLQHFSDSEHRSKTGFAKQVILGGNLHNK